MISKNFWALILPISLSFLFLNGAADPHLDITGSEAEALKYLSEVDTRYSSSCNKDVNKRWDYITSGSEASATGSTLAHTEFLNFQRIIQEEIFEKFPNWREFINPVVKRAFKYLAVKGPSTMSSKDVANMVKLQKDMESLYGKVTICEYKNPAKCDLGLSAINQKLKAVNDYDELAHYWTSWHDKMGENIPVSKYQQYVSYQNAMAKANGFSDMSEMWMLSYDDESVGWTGAEFKKQMVDLWESIRPLYEKMHAYVRMKLRRLPEYKEKIDKCGYLPAHILGNMYAQSWGKFDSMTKPFPDVPSLYEYATKEMIKKNYTILKIYQESEKFYTSLGLSPMTQDFWKKSIFECLSDAQEVVPTCATDFCLGRNSTDFRLIHCTQLNAGELVEVHYVMGYVEYPMAYTNLNYIFRRGANPGFIEAISRAAALSVGTPTHLQCKLSLDLKQDPEICSGKRLSVTDADINNLYSMAMNILPFFPFAISLESWRWEAFEGLDSSKYSKRWWELRMANQGIKPPSNRSSEDLFDPSSKYHVGSNSEYLGYFLGNILQFQFYESLCITAGEYSTERNDTKPLHQCDFSGSLKAGNNKMKEMMALGFSKSWPEALQVLTGSRTIATSSMEKYFQPLVELIEEELSLNKEVPGFGENCSELTEQTEKQ